MRVLVVGGSGFVGIHLCSELVERGHEVTALSRSPGAADLPGAVETYAGDVTDYASVEGAFADQDAVVNLVALSPLFEPPRGNGMHERVHLDGTENAVRAAAAHGVERFVQMSALGADPDGPTAYIRAKGRAERVVRESALDWVVVRPSVVFGEGGEFVPFTKLLTTPYVTGLPGGGETRFQPIWVGDLVPLLADAVEDGARAGATYEVGGPEVLTLAAVARLAYRAEGKPLSVLPVPMGLAKLGLTVGGAVPGFPMGPDQYRSLAFDNTVADNDVTAFGVDPDELTTLAAYLGAEDDVAVGWTTPAAAVGGLVAWLGSMALLLGAGLLADVWRLSDLPGRLAVGAEALTVVATALLVGGPVALYLRARLRAPLALALLYFGGWSGYGLLTGFGPVRSLFVALLYGVYPVLAVLLAAGLEALVRGLRPGPADVEARG